ncbi:MAG TPA: hypothetical protein VHA56_20605 [Mucilaginibacter sp.]|nr:hypothetical protein [Mucilaginibacter sp.]
MAGCFFLVQHWAENMYFQTKLFLFSDCCNGKGPLTNNAPDSYSRGLMGGFFPAPPTQSNKGGKTKIQPAKANQGPGANETPGVNVYHNLTFGGNWSYPGLGMHLYPNQPLSTRQHEYGHYLQYKQMNIVSYTWFVAIPSSINRGLINMGLHTNDHDRQPYELEASTLADKFYGKNSRMGLPDNPTFRDYPELAPKTFQEGWNDIVREFNRWVSWGH